MTTLGKILAREIPDLTEAQLADHKHPNALRALRIIEQYADDLAKAKSDIDRSFIRSTLTYRNKGDYADLREAKADDKGTLYAWLTVSPDTSRKGYTFSAFKTHAITFLHRACHEKGLMVFEQRGSTAKTSGDGAHIHCILKRDLSYAPKTYARLIKSSFNKWVDVNRPGPFFLQYKSSKLIQDKIDYIIGVKTGEGKLAKQVIDVKFREYNCLDPVYSKNWSI